MEKDGLVVSKVFGIVVKRFVILKPVRLMLGRRQHPIHHVSETNTNRACIRNDSNIITCGLKRIVF